MENNINISNDDLITIIKKNNEDMQRIINQTSFNDSIANDKVKRLFLDNLSFYKIAKSRNLNIDGFSFMMAVATNIGYNIDDYLICKNTKKH